MVHKYTCPSCLVEFSTEHKSKIYCSVRCKQRAKDARRQRRDGDCAHCGAAFTQSGPGRRRSWCYDCLPPFGESNCDKAYHSRATALKKFVESGVHLSCCGVHPVKMKSPRYGVGCCVRCGDQYNRRSLVGVGGSYCGPCSLEARRMWRRAERFASVEADCAWCFKSFTGRAGKRFCSKNCRSSAVAHNKVWKRMDSCIIPTCFECCSPMPFVGSNQGTPLCRNCSISRKGASEVRRRECVSAGTAGINWKSVGERDGWFCHLCGKRVKAVPGGAHEPNGANVDHLIPISAGGKHEWSNVAISHRSCNVSRGAKGVAQLRLA